MQRHELKCSGMKSLMNTNSRKRNRSMDVILNEASSQVLLHETGVLSSEGITLQQSYSYNVQSLHNESYTLQSSPYNLLTLQNQAISVQQSHLHNLQPNHHSHQGHSYFPHTSQPSPMHQGIQYSQTEAGSSIDLHYDGNNEPVLMDINQEDELFFSGFIDDDAITVDLSIDDSSIIWDLRQLFDLEFLSHDNSPYPRGDNSDIPSEIRGLETPLHGAGCPDENNAAAVAVSVLCGSQTNQNNIHDGSGPPVQRRSNTCLKSLTRVIHDSDQVKDILFSMPVTKPPVSNNNSSSILGGSNRNFLVDETLDRYKKKQQQQHDKPSLSNSRQSRVRARPSRRRRHYQHSSASSSSSCSSTSLSSSSSSYSRSPVPHHHRHHRINRCHCSCQKPLHANNSCCNSSNSNCSHIPPQPQLSQLPLLSQPQPPDPYQAYHSFNHFISPHAPGMAYYPGYSDMNQMQSHKISTDMYPQPYADMTYMYQHPYEGMNRMFPPFHESINSTYSQPRDEMTPMYPQPHDEMTPMYPQPHDEMNPMYPQPHDEMTPMYSQPHDDMAHMYPQPHNDMNPMYLQSEEGMTDIIERINRLNHSISSNISPCNYNNSQPQLHN